MRILGGGFQPYELIAGPCWALRFFSPVHFGNDLVDHKQDFDLVMAGLMTNFLTNGTFLKSQDSLHKLLISMELNAPLSDLDWDGF